uniref:Tetratricopeptide repeat protein n=1 Tax=mine drainage metagenome TaxID=410659 RepID=E6QRU1_9ZZZZ
MTPAAFSQQPDLPPQSPGGNEVAQTDFGEWLDVACLGGMLPPSVAADLQRAAAAYHLDEVAESYLMQAYARAPDHPAVHIALYRFYFYKNRLTEALVVAQRCLTKTAKDLGLPMDWRDMPSDHTVFASHGDNFAAAPRFYLFTLKACAYLNMRLGELAQGAEMVTKLMAMDPGDKLGGSVLRGILDRVGRHDDDE